QLPWSIMRPNSPIKQQPAQARVRFLRVTRNHPLCLFKVMFMLHHRAAEHTRTKLWLPRFQLTNWLVWWTSEHGRHPWYLELLAIQTNFPKAVPCVYAWTEKQCACLSTKL
ncbi:Cytochrome bd ubiquinol oxidase subunit 1, partial [Clarias magur]